MKLILFLVGFFALTASQEEEYEPEERWLLGDSYLKVKTSDGYVKGYLGASCRTGKKFAGFRGIPYAKPPLEALRFKSPEPPKKWEGVWDASFQRPSCIQENINASDPINVNGFSEDCLYLNVYSPNLKYLKYGMALLNPLKPVMVFIHPGAFTTGTTSESLVSPDFLVDHDVLLVTFNYRLGALGFLSFQNEEVPGNAGLKDQNMVLKWVKENIRHFGGDPSRITIFGESAGAASVNYHILSQASRGLFSNAIMQSGSALSSWAYSTPELSLRKARNLAKKIGCSKKNVTATIECMQQAPAELICEKQQKALTLGELLSLKIIAFHPTTEPQVPGAFLTTPPFELMYSGNFTKVPSIIGLNSEEGLLVYPTLTASDPLGLLLSLIGMDLSRFAPPYFHLKPFTKPAIYAHQQISRFYFNSKALTKALMGNALDLVTDVMFTLPIQLTASLFADNQIPVYNYLFTYDGGYNLFKAATNIMKVPGVSHGDDLGYLFYTPLLHQNCGTNVTAHSLDELTVDRMTKMWTNFAKTGHPVTKADKDLGIVWEPFTSTERKYVDIGKDLVPSEGLKLGNMVFWENLIKNLIEMDKAGGPKQAIDDLEIPQNITYI